MNSENTTFDSSLLEEFEQFLESVRRGEHPICPGDYFELKSNKHPQKSHVVFILKDPISNPERLLRGGEYSASEMRQRVYDLYLREEKENAKNSRIHG